MITQLPGIPRIIVVGFLLVGYYYFVKKFLIQIARYFSFHTRSFTTKSKDEIKGVSELVLIVAGHLCFMLFMLWFSGLSISALSLSLEQIPVLIAGIFLGISELAISMFACEIVMAFYESGQTIKTDHSLLKALNLPLIKDSSSWMSSSRGGWIRHHLTAVRVLPFPIAIVLSSVQVACEELVFRAILFSVFADFGKFYTILVSGAYFVLMQALFMQSKRAAMFPMVGALTMAILHGVLFSQTGYIWPLVIAHITFFVVTVM